MESIKKMKRRRERCIFGILLIIAVCMTAGCADTSISAKTPETLSCGMDKEIEENALETGYSFIDGFVDEISS